jgi:16S rRNA C1402 (ribose-2'-O) methylase RsmI
LIARELTKRHQELVLVSDIWSISQLPREKGEFTVVVGPRLEPHDEVPAASDSLIYSEFCHLTASLPGGRRAAMAVVARKYGRSTKQVYAIVEAHKNATRDG